MAINLAEALRLKGHDVTLWSPHSMPNLTRWWQGLQSIQLMRSKLDAFIATQERFDIIDTSAHLITKRVAQSGLVVARSVQPQILYILSDLKDKPETSLKEIILLPFDYLFFITVVFLLMQGWQRSKYIFCLGSLELEWMKKWFPWWRSKLIFYVNALSKADQVELTNIRLNRKKHESEGIRFLWIGRWTAHKGIHELVDFIIQRAASHPEDTFTIAGCGTNAEKDFSPELIQSGRLKILPSFERNQLYSLLANHDAGLFTSKVEGWGLVLNEMLESGMPVFAKPAGGVTDLQEFFKILMTFPPPPQLMLDIISSYIDVDDYYRRYSWETIAENYITKIFKKITS
ncbi:MAG: glycosyltransferase family 4 protein [Nostoc sp.]|uniref:glycosyltransferase family 4 protein n=1 Tax=Nostoc sp. TaxID=1180 RepID=UPI002FF6D609